MDGIPVIDIGPFLTDAPGAGAVAAEVEQACRAIGFFLITGHRVPEPVVADLSERARRFFDDPVATPGEPRPGGVSYAPLEQEALAATRGARGPGDLKHSLNYGPRLPGQPWPASPPGLAQAFTAYFTAMAELSAALRRLFCRAIGLPADHFEPMFRADLSALRVIDYPAQPQGARPGQLRAGAHTDYGFLTILRAEASSGGLQVQTRSGDWIDAPVLADAFIVNIGDAVMRWTNGAWVSTPHRVVNPPDAGARRQSIAFFLNPDPDAEIRCLEPFCTAERPARFAPTTYADYIALKTRQAFGPA